MSENAPDAASEPDVDPALVEAMRERVVKPRGMPYGSRKAGPGRPKGGRKTGGKKAGTPNLFTPEFREYLAERAKPFEVLATICAGEEIEDGDTRRKPTVPERMRAAETLARKLLPDLAATTLSGPRGGPVEMEGLTAAPYEVARRLAFLLAQGVQDQEDRNMRTMGLPRPAQSPAPSASYQSPPTPPEPGPQPGETLTVGEGSITFAELLPGGRERWAIRDGNGRLVGAAFGKDEAVNRARRIGAGE